MVRYGLLPASILTMTMTMVIGAVRVAATNESNGGRPLRMSHLATTEPETYPDMMNQTIRGLDGNDNIFMDNNEDPPANGKNANADDGALDPVEWSIKEMELGFHALDLEEPIGKEYPDNGEGVSNAEDSVDGHHGRSLIQGNYLIKNNQNQEYLNSGWNNVFAGGNKQYWYFQPLSWDSMAFELNFGGKCLDYNFNTGKAYMHTCHGGKNQHWHFIGSSWTNMQVKTAYDWKCLDRELDNAWWENPEFLLYSCNGGRNQRFGVYY